MAFGLGFQHIPWDLANVYAWKTMFDPYNKGLFGHSEIEKQYHIFILFQS